MTYTGGWPGRINPKRHREEVIRALERGRCVNASTNAKIVFKGAYQQLWTFEGPRSIATGWMEFHHYDARVMAVDFDHDRITDFGYSGHSPTTTLNINMWLRALQGLEVENMFSLTARAFPFAWTRTIHNKLRGAGYHEEMWQRFRARVPWVWKSPSRDWWFYGPGWSSALFDAFGEGREEALNGPNNEHPGEGYRWFTYDWDKDGRWTKRFINERGERLYHAWCRRKGLT